MLSYAENPVNGIFSHTAAILPRNGSARLHIPRGQRGRGQNPTQILWESPNFHLTKCYFYHFFANFALDKRS